MFGQKDDKPADQNGDGTAGSAPIASAATDPAASISDNAAWQHPGTPLDTSAPPTADVISPAGGFPSAASNKITAADSDEQQPDPQVEAEVSQAADQLLAKADDKPAPAEPPAQTEQPGNGDLVEIKQKALNELAPLIDQLDLMPEDKFRTVMMMIQASDDQTLIEKAYEVAHSIENEHARAQALLDIVNEINYFTQPPSTDQPEAQTS